MVRVRVYSTELCNYCVQTKRWLTENNIEFEEIVLNNQQAITQFQEDCPGQRTVPQLLIDGDLITGGYFGLMENKEEILTLLK